jgi:hypothetical protein
MMRAPSPHAVLRETRPRKREHSSRIPARRPVPPLLLAVVELPEGGVSAPPAQRKSALVEGWIRRFHPNG